MFRRVLDRSLRVSLFLLSAFIGIASIASTAPHAAAQESDQDFLPGFAYPGDGVSALTTIGSLDPALSEPATLTIERLRIAPGDSVPATDGAQIIQVEHGSLSYTDDLGLDAELGADAAGFFAAGSTTEIANEGGVPAIVLRTVITGQPATATSGNEQPDEDNGDTSGETGERPSSTPASGGNAVPPPSDSNQEDSEANPQPPAVTNTIGNTRAAETTTPVTADPSASPVASPVATEEPPAPIAPVAGLGKLGVLLTADLTNLPGSPQQFFAGTVVLQPGAGIELTGSTGQLGLLASGGDLTVERDGRASAKLRDGRSVILPAGVSASFINDGETPLSVQIAGISGSSAVGNTPDNETADAETTSTPDASLDGEPVDMTGPARFIPTNREMEQLGLFPVPGEPVISSDAEQNRLWFSSGNEAESTLAKYNWQNFLISGYDSQSNSTDYGVVEYLAINVDTFASKDDCTAFYTFLQDDSLGGNASHSPDLGSLPGVDAEMRIGRFIQDSGLEFGLMVIRSGEYVVTIFVNGPDVNAIGLMEALAKLIFGPRG